MKCARRLHGIKGRLGSKNHLCNASQAPACAKKLAPTIHTVRISDYPLLLLRNPNDETTTYLSILSSQNAVHNCIALQTAYEL